MHRLERVGIVVGNSFDLNGAPPAIKSAFECGVADARKVITDEARKLRRGPKADCGHGADTKLQLRVDGQLSC